MSKQGPYTGVTADELIHDAEEARKSGKFKWLQEYCPTCHAITFVPEPEGYMYCQSCGRKRSQYAKTNHIVDADKVPVDSLSKAKAADGCTCKDYDCTGKHCEESGKPRQAGIVASAQEEASKGEWENKICTCYQFQGDSKECKSCYPPKSKGECNCLCHFNRKPTPEEYAVSSYYGCKHCQTNPPEHEEDEVEKIINPFIEKWLPDSYPHLVDTDENDGQRLRNKIRDNFVSKEKIKRVLLESTYIKMYARKKILKSLGIEP